MTSLNERIWKKLFEKIINRVYSKILSKEECQNRIDYITSKLDSLSPEILYKNLIYNDTNFEVGKLAIDYRLKFISDDYKSTIDSAISLGLETSYFQEEIRNISLIINLAISIFILHGKNPDIDNLDLDQAKLKFKNAFENKTYGSLPGIFIQNGYINYFMTHNQAVCMALFNPRLPDGHLLSKNTIDKIKIWFKSRCDLFESLRENHPNGINIDLIRNQNFLG